MRIYIDAGHGNNTAGKGSPYALNKVKPALELREWKWAREIAAKVFVGLRKLGYDDVVLLTPEDWDVPLLTRIHRVNAACQQYGKSEVLVVSIHGNALGHGHEWNSARGWCAYTSPGQTKSDILAEHLYDAAVRNFPGMKIRTEKTPDGDRDYEARFAILTRTLCAAVLTENFFYTNIQDCKFMLSEEGKDAIVRTHIEGIDSYIKSLEAQ